MSNDYEAFLKEAQNPTTSTHKTPSEMTPEERIASMREFAESKKYVYPGQDGTIAGGVNGTGALAFGGPIDSPGPRIAVPKQHGGQLQQLENEEGAQAQAQQGRRRSSFMDKGRGIMDKLRSKSHNDSAAHNESGQANANAHSYDRLEDGQ